MSTKIFNGYLLDIPDTIGGTIRFLHGVGDDARELASEIATRHVAWRATQVFDFLSVGEPLEIDGWGGRTAAKPGDSPLVMAMSEAMSKAAEVRKTGMRNPFWDLSCSVAITNGREKGKTLALFYAERDEFKSMWEANKLVSPWPYWDNVDRPDEVTNKAWKYRGRAWEEAIGDMSPAQAGLVQDLVPEGYWPIIHAPDAIRAVPSLDSRAHDLATEMICRERIRDLAGLVKSEDVTKTLRWVATPEGQSAVRDRALDVAKKLKEHLTTDDLCGRSG